MPYKSGTKPYTNGTVTKYFIEGEQPDGFYLGQAPRKNDVEKTKICKRCGKQFKTFMPRANWCDECNNEVHKEVECQVCGKKFIQKFNNEKTCSRKCAAKMRGNFKNPVILQKIAYTNIQNLGCANPFNSPEIQQKCCDNKQVICKHHLSHNAQIVYDMLKNDGIHTLITTEKLFDDCKFIQKLPFDFYIPAGNGNSELLIEYDGEHHTHPVKYSNELDVYKAFIHTQVTDWIKDKYCIEHNIPLIRIKAPEYIPNDFDDLYSNSYIIGSKQGSDNIIHAFDVNANDFINYKKCSFTIQSGISCTFKCERDCGQKVCHNNSLVNLDTTKYFIDYIINEFLNQKLAKAFVFQGLEPLDNLKELLWFIHKLRTKSDADVVVYTGYTKDECGDLIKLINLMGWNNIIIKFGRYIPGHKPHFDECLGIELASDNQFAEKIS